MALVLPFIATVFAGYLVYITIHNLFFHPLSHLPGPFLSRISCLPSFYHACKKDRHIWHWRNFQVYGSKYRAAPNLVVFNSPDVYNQIYSHKANVKRSNFYDAWSRNADDVNTLMTSDMKLHARKRRLLNLAFTDHSIKAAGGFIIRHIDKWLELIGGEKTEDGWSEVHDIAHEANYLMFDILSDLCFGADFRTKEPGENKYKKIPEAFDTFVAFNKHPLHELVLWLKPRGLYSLLEKVAPQPIKDHYAFVDMMISKRWAAEQKREAINGPVEREDMLHFLCNARDPDTGERAFDEKSLCAEANLLIMAGSDTTAIAISSMFFYITHNQRVYAKLIHEIRSTFDSLAAVVDGPRLLNCKYLRACIDETLRLAPGGPSELPREILEGGMKIDGMFFPEGTVVGTPNWAMGRNEEHYGDATTFRPERWIASDDVDTLNPEEEVLRLKRGLHTFLKGPGDCVGQRLAIVNLCLVVGRTLWQFDVRVAPGTHVGEGRAELGWGRRDARQFMMQDAYISLREGPLVQVRRRAG